MITPLLRVILCQSLLFLNDNTSAQYNGNCHSRDYERYIYVACSGDSIYIIHFNVYIDSVITGIRRAVCHNLFTRIVDDVFYQRIRIALAVFGNFLQAEYGVIILILGKRAGSVQNGGEAVGAFYIPLVG